MTTVPSPAHARAAGRRAAWRWAAAGAGGTAGDALFDPQHRHVPLCPFKAATGLQCPLCGGLRAVNAAAHGHLQSAWHDNALLWVTLPFLLAFWAVAVSGRPVRPSRRAIVALIVAAVAFTVLRNAVPALRLLPT